ncbi:MAG TPA: LapA family protein [Sneathiellales bacterium]|nr:LapA family protein [Sneathiellales bacterium]
MKIMSRMLAVIVATLVALLAVANRQTVTVSMDPLPYEITGPLYAILLAAAIIGVSAGGLLGWTSSLKWRRTVRRQTRELATMAKRLKKTGTNGAAAPESRQSPEDRVPAPVAVLSPPG